MAFNLKQLKTGDEVYVKASTIKHLCKDCPAYIQSVRDNVSIKFLAMESNLGFMYVINPDVGQFPVTSFKLYDDITGVKSGEELLFPKAFLTESERAFILGLKPILTNETIITKVAEPGGVFEYIKLTGVRTKKNCTEVVDFPCFYTGEYYIGLEAQKYYTLADLGINVNEK